MRYLSSLILCMALVGGAGCVVNKDDSSCFTIGVTLNMPLAQQGLNPALVAEGTFYDLCIGSVCDRAKLVARGATAGVMHFEDVDHRTERFAVEGTAEVQSSTGKGAISLNVNTAYGGHAGQDKLTLTAVDAQGARTIVLQGNVSFKQVSGSVASNACGAPFYEGTFTEEELKP